jgi:hypothetical protein
LHTPAACAELFLMSDPPEIFHLGQPARDDPAGYVRASSGMIALCGASGVTGALLERSLSTRGRIAAAAGMAGVTAIALAGVRNPRAVSRILVEHPTATMLARLFPLGVTPLLGRRFNAMHMLSLTGIGDGSGRVSFALYGRTYRGVERLDSESTPG